MDLRAVVEEAEHEQASESERLRMRLDFSEDFRNKLFAIDSTGFRRVWLDR
jgi:hypothetical protein